MDPTLKNARCLNCNYPLHSLPATTCPECGKPFNPADAKTMNLGRIPGPIAKKLLTHTGWPTLLLALAAPIALFIISGPPRLVPPRLNDTFHYLNRRHWNDYVHPTDDKAYAAAVLLWIFFITFLFLRVA